MKRTFFILLVFIIGIVFVSCDKENEQIGNSNTTHNLQLKDGDSTGYYTDSTYITSEGLIYTYFKDGIKRRVIEFRPNIEEENGTNSNSDLYLIIMSMYNAQNVLTGFQIQEFTSYSAYITYGNTLDGTFGNMMQLRSNLVNYAEQNGTISEFETTGIIPTSYQTYFDNQFQTYFPNNSKIWQPVEVHTEYTNTSNDRTWLHPLGYAVCMAPGFNDQVSRYKIWSPVGAFLYIFNKTFYRQLISVIWSWGNTTYRFEGPLLFLNNTMSSFMS